MTKRFSGLLVYGPNISWALTMWKALCQSGTLRWVRHHNSPPAVYSQWRRKDQVITKPQFRKCYVPRVGCGLSAVGVEKRERVLLTVRLKRTFQENDIWVSTQKRRGFLLGWQLWEPPLRVRGGGLSLNMLCWGGSTQSPALSLLPILWAQGCSHASGSRQPSSPDQDPSLMTVFRGWMIETTPFPNLPCSLCGCLWESIVWGHSSLFFYCSIFPTEDHSSLVSQVINIVNLTSILKSRVG